MHALLLTLLLGFAVPVKTAPRIAWAPQPGAQVLLMACPFWEALLEGNRGGGKTAVLIADFAQHCGPKMHEEHQAGYGAAWRGILFRRTFPDLTDFIAKSKALFAQIFPTAKYNESSFTWKWPTGEQLLLRHALRTSDVDGFQGHEYPWLGFEELGTWATPDIYDLMKATSRSSTPNMPRKIRSTCNPAGVGHNWIKRRFIDPAPACVPIQDKDGNWRVRIHSDLDENKALLAADPNYKAKIAAAAGSNEHKRRAWLYGDWNIVAGGMFDDVWDEKRHILKPFAIPEGWRMSRAFDWGSSRPFSVGWWARGDGTQPEAKGDSLPFFPRGSYVRVNEWYGWNGEEANVGLKMSDRDIASGILERETRMKIRERVNAGPADSAIFSGKPGEPTTAQILDIGGVPFEAANKASGSRVRGWSAMRTMLLAAKEDRKEEPGLWVFDVNRDGFIRTVPTLSRDDKNPDDVDSDSEDHAADETRYQVMDELREAAVVNWRV